MPERIALDVHAHLVPVDEKKLAAIDGVSWNQDQAILTVDGHAVGMKPLFDPPALLRWMDENNVAIAWISIPPPLYRPHLRGNAARAWDDYVNGGLLDIASKKPDRFEALVHLQLQDPAVAVETARRSIKNGRRRFSAPSGGIGELVLSDKVFAPLWRELDDAAAFVFFHPGECADGRLAAFYLSNLVGNPYETAVAISHLTLGGVIERFGNITFCFAHGGGALPMLAGRLERGFQTARPGIDIASLPPKTSLGRICVDCITHDPSALALAEQTFGEAHVVFGSDWPFPMGLVDPHRQLAGLDRQQRVRIFCDNPETITGKRR